MKAYVFGYGSLVNARTHDYPSLHAARLPGWRRRWCHAEGRNWAFLAAVPSDSVLDGVIAEVPDAEWDALDAREASYERVETEGVEHPLSGPARIRHYRVPEGHDTPPERLHPVLLSYLDVCVEGYLDVFGPPGVTRFFKSTDGWEAPLLDDRSAPIYRRHTSPTTEVTAATDAALHALGVIPMPLSAMVEELERAGLASEGIGRLTALDGP